MEAYDPATVFSSIDRHGRYAYGNQPQIAQWNLARFAETLLSVVHPQEEAAVALANEALGGFGERFQRHWLAGMRRKLGLFNEEPEDLALIEALLTWMHAAKADFTNTWAELETLGRRRRAGRVSFRNGSPVGRRGVRGNRRRPRTCRGCGGRIVRR